MTKSYLDNLARQVCRQMWRHCKKCGYSGPGLEVSHYRRRELLGTRWSPLNLDLLCGNCHHDFEMDKNAYREWKERVDGEWVVKHLHIRSIPGWYLHRYTTREWKLASAEALKRLLADIESGECDPMTGVVPL